GNSISSITLNINQILLINIFSYLNLGMTIIKIEL
ncbi:MAG: hypothetical protein ACI9O1_001125, partial [Candidatus Thalassarchaeaceae archaeon]